MGFASGFHAGAQAAERGLKLREEEQQRQALRDAARATPELSQGYTAEQGAQLEAAAKSGLYDIGMKADEAGNFQGYTVTPKASPEMQGLVAPGQVSDIYGQRYAGTLAPEQLQGLRMGRMADIVAETDPIRSQQLRAAQAEQEFLAKSRPMQLESGALRLEGERADAADRKRMTDFQAWVQEDPARGQNFQAVAAKARELGMSTKQQYEIASNLTGIDKAEFEASQSSIRKLLHGKDLNGALAAHKDSDLITPGSHYEVVRGKNGQVSLNNVDTATGKIIQANIFSGTEAEALGYLNKAAMDPASIVDYTLNLQKSKAAIMQSEASARASDATVGLRSAQLTALQNQQAGSVEAARIREQYMDLTPEEQAGPKGQGLIRQFNMANAKAGATVPLGPAPRTERTQLSPGEVTNRAKALVEAREKNPDTNKPYTLTEALRFVEGGMRDPVAEALDKALGGGGDPFAQKAKPVSAAAPAAPAPALRRDAGERNPFVDAQGRPLPNAPAGAPSLASQAPAAIQQGVSRALSAGERNYAAYLQSKIDARQPLTADEAIRARRFGLTP